MRRARRMCAAAWLGLAGAGALAQSVEDGTHLVEASDTLAAIAERYALDDWGCVVAWNAAVADEGLVEGASIVVHGRDRAVADAALCRRARESWEEQERGPTGALPRSGPTAHLGDTTASVMPIPDERERRILQVEYAPNRVVRVQTQVGISTLFVFELGEEVIDWFAGDTGAWDVTHKDNLLALKPKAELPETNLVIRTDRRRYHAELVVSEDPFFEVKWVYSDTERRKGIERALEKALLSPTSHLDYERTFGLGVNARYSAAGSGNFRPDRVVDNGRLTYLHFPEDRDVPAPYWVDLDGTERLLNFSMRGNWMILFRVGRLFRLRHGQSVICLRNDNYRPAHRDAPSETVADDIFRMLGGGG